MPQQHTRIPRGAEQSAPRGAYAWMVARCLIMAFNAVVIDPRKSVLSIFSHIVYIFAQKSVCYKNYIVYLPLT